MSKPRKKLGNPDFCHSSSVPAPPTEEIESRFFELLSPATFTKRPPLHKISEMS